ncbi:unnamed protein product [Closterium sp. NIES-54]
MHTPRLLLFSTPSPPCLLLFSSLFSSRLLPLSFPSPPPSPPLTLLLSSVQIQASQFEFIALMPFTKGAELFTSYGPKVNEELLLGYGFVLDGNKQENVLLFRTLLDAVNLVALVLHRDAARPGEWVVGPGGLGGAAGKGGKTGEARDVSECHEGSEGEGEEEEEGKKRTCAAKYGDEAVEGGGAAVSAEAGSKGDMELKQGLARIWGEGLGDWLVNEGADGDADGDDDDDDDDDDDGYSYGDDYEEDDDEDDDDEEAAGSRWGKSKAQERGKKRKNSNRNKHKNKKKSKGKSKSGSRHGKQKQKKSKKQQQSDSPTAKLLRVRQALWRVAAKAVEAIARERAKAEKQFVHVGAMPQYLARQEIRRESEADEVNGGVEVLAGKYKDPSFGVSVWRGGIVEPNLMAVFAAVWYYLKHHSEPPSDMAKSVLYLGWGVSNSGCRDVASPFSNVLPALQAAADTVRLLAQARLQQMPTSIEEDEAILRELEQCKSGGKMGAGGGEGVKGGKLGKEGKKKPAQSKQQQKAKLTSLEEEVSAKRLSRRRRRRAVSGGRISDDYSDDDNNEGDNTEEETDLELGSRSDEEEAIDCDAWAREQASGESEEEGGGSESGNGSGGSSGGAKRLTVMRVRCGCEEFRAEADERMVAVRFRKAKKAVLKEVVDRLRKACPASPTAFL